MNILIDIGHPAHVHLFKHFAWEMQQLDHKILFTCRDKEFEIYLLKYYGFQFKSFGKKYLTQAGKFWGLIEFDIKEIFAGIEFKPDIFLSHGSIYAAHAAFLLGKPHISFEDTGNWEQVKLYLPFTKVVLTSEDFPYNYGEKQLRIKSHNEIAYLHPDYFKPDPDFKRKIGLNSEDKYIILRFVAWNASHDRGQYGLSYSEKLKIVEDLSKEYKVFISSESRLENKLDQYRITFSPHEIHDALFYANMFIGEGTTMAMEAAILGTPSIYVNTLQYSNIKDMAKYKLLYNLIHEKNKLQKIIELASLKDLKDSLIEPRKKMLFEKVNITSFLVWFAENYPNSFKIVKESPDYQYQFK